MYHMIKTSHTILFYLQFLIKTFISEIIFVQWCILRAYNAEDFNFFTFYLYCQLKYRNNKYRHRIRYEE